MPDWKDRVAEVLTSKNISLEDINQMIELKSRYVPTQLFKYRDFSNKFHMSSLIDKTLWMAGANTFNDPYDTACYINYSNVLVEDLTEAEHMERIREMRERKPVKISALKKPIPFSEFAGRIAEWHRGRVTPEETEEFVQRSMVMRDLIASDISRDMTKFFQAGHSVFSASERIDSIVMWGHYGALHTGFAIEYDFHSLGHSDATNRMLFPVIYSRKLFDMTSSLTFSEGERLNNLMALYASINKNAEWSYEHEWRLIHNLQEPGYAIPAPPIRAIYVGSRCEKSNITISADIAEEFGVPMYQMQLSHSQYKLEPLRIV